MSWPDDSICSPDRFESSIWILTCTTDWSTYSSMSNRWTLRSSHPRAGSVCCRHLLGQRSGATAMMMMMMMTSLSHYAKTNTSESSYSNPQPPFRFQSFYYSLVVSQNKGEINVFFTCFSRQMLCFLLSIPMLSLIQTPNISASG